MSIRMSSWAWTIVAAAVLALPLYAAGCSGDAGHRHGDDEHDEHDGHGDEHGRHDDGDDHDGHGHHGDDHDGHGHHGGHEHGEGPGRLVDTVRTGGHSLTLRVKPGRVEAGEEAEFEVEILEQDADGEGLPPDIEDVRINFYPVRAGRRDRRLATAKAHVEGSASVYGVHQTLPERGGYEVEVTARVDGGRTLRASFRLRAE